MGGRDGLPGLGRDGEVGIVTRPEWIARYVARCTALGGPCEPLYRSMAADAIDGDGPYGESANLHRSPEDMADEDMVDEDDEV